MASTLAFVGMNQSLVNAEIATIVAELAGGARMSRRRLARESGVSLSTLNRMWAGQYEVGLGNLVAIAGVLNTTAADIMQSALDRVGAEKALEDVRSILSGQVSEGGAKVTSIESKRAAAEKLTTEDIESIQAGGRAAASEDDDATRDEPEGP